MTTQRPRPTSRRGSKIGCDVPKTDGSCCARKAPPLRPCARRSPKHSRRFKKTSKLFSRSTAPNFRLGRHKNKPKGIPKDRNNVCGPMPANIVSGFWNSHRPLLRLSDKMCDSNAPGIASYNLTAKSRRAILHHTHRLGQIFLRPGPVNMDSFLKPQGPEQLSISLGPGRRKNWPSRWIWSISLA